MNSCSTYTLISPLVLLLTINQACLFHAIHATCVFLSKVKQGACLIVALPLTLKSILRKKKNYGNSNISPQKYNLQKFL
jgi:hypothetical protein